MFYIYIYLSSSGAAYTVTHTDLKCVIILIHDIHVYRRRNGNNYIYSDVLDCF